MADLRFALLNASFNGESSSLNFRRDLPVPVDEYDVKGGELPPDYDVDAAVVTGSKASTYWDEAWIDGLRDWIGEADDRDVPLLGICFGHQVVADALGGTVADMGEYELGYRAIEHDGEDPLFDGIDRRFTAFTTHHDEVVDLPAGARVTARNDCSVQGFRRDAAFGVQFHPEFDRETARRATENKDLPEERLRPVLDGITPETERAAEPAKRVFENFRRVVARRRSPAPADD